MDKKLNRQIGYVKPAKSVETAPVQAEKPAKKKTAKTKPAPVSAPLKHRGGVKLYDNAKARCLYMPEEFWQSIDPTVTGMTRNSFLVAAGKEKLAKLK